MTRIARQAICFGGDTDTIGCMVGSMAGAFWGTTGVICTHTLALTGTDPFPVLEPDPGIGLAGPRYVQELPEKMA